MKKLISILFAFAFFSCSCFAATIDLLNKTDKKLHVRFSNKYPCGLCTLKHCYIAAHEKHQTSPFTLQEESEDQPTSTIDVSMDDTSIHQETITFSAEAHYSLEVFEFKEFDARHCVISLFLIDDIGNTKTRLTSHTYYKRII